MKKKQKNEIFLIRKNNEYKKIKNCYTFFYSNILNSFTKDNIKNLMQSLQHDLLNT